MTEPNIGNHLERKRLVLWGVDRGGRFYRLQRAGSSAGILINPNHDLGLRLALATADDPNVQH